MTTKTKTGNTSTPTVSDNKAIFAPLGKYAVIGVIMVSIIVTTAIMLDKQLSTVEEKIAAIESKVVELNTKDTSVTEITASTSTESETTNEVASVNDEQQNTDVVVKSDTTVETLSAEVPVTTEAAPEVSSQTVNVLSSNNNTQQEMPETEIIAKANMVKSETATTENTIQTSQAPFAMTNMDKTSFEQERQARMDTFKHEQKQRMSDMFARIKVLESEQLDQYKANKEKQIVRLREQLAQQQQMIEALVLRNNDLFELRAANVQRIQENREKMLNRI